MTDSTAIESERQADPQAEKKSGLGVFQFGLAGMFIVMTIVCIRMAIFSYYSNHPQTTLHVPAPGLAATESEALNAKIAEVDGVQLVEYDSGQIVVTIRKPNVSSKVLAVIRDDGVDVRRIQVTSNSAMMNLEKEKRDFDSSSLAPN